MKQSLRSDFGIFYDPRKGGVDFLLKPLIGKTIPIEVGYGKKSKKQIKSAMNKYKSDYGIIVSNTTDSIVKDDNVIFIPLKTFSLI